MPALESTERSVGTVQEEPFGSRVDGLVTLFRVILVAVVCVVTIIKILVAVPFLLLTYVVWTVRASIAFFTIADRLTDTRLTG